MINHSLPVRLGDPDKFIVNSRLFDICGSAYCTEYFYWAMQRGWYYNFSGHKINRVILSMSSPLLSSDWFFDSNEGPNIVFRSLPTMTYGRDGKPELALGLFDYENKNRLDFELCNFGDKIIAHHNNAAFFVYTGFDPNIQDRIKLQLRPNCYIVIDYLSGAYALDKDINGIVEDFEKLDSRLRSAFSNCSSERLLTGIIPICENDQTVDEIVFTLDLLYTYPSRAIFKISNYHRYGLYINNYRRCDVHVKFLTNMGCLIDDLSIRPGRKPGLKILRINSFGFNKEIHKYGLSLDNFKDMILHNKLEIAKSIYRKIRNKIKKSGTFQVGKLKVI